MSKWKLGTGMRAVEKAFWEPVKKDKQSNQKTKGPTKEINGVMCRKVWRMVKTNMLSRGSKLPTNDFTEHPENCGFEAEWPTYTKESQRIKANTESTRDLTITEAFAKILGIEFNASEEIVAKVNCTPTDLHVGDEIDMEIKSISKNNVEFDCMNLKQTINSCVNLHRFQNFKRFTPKGKVRVRVTAATPQRVVVDPISPMVEDYVNPIIANPIIQKVMEGEPHYITVKNLKLTRGGFIGQAVIPDVSSWVGEDYTIEAFIPGSQIVLNIEENFDKWIGKTVQAFITNYIPKPTYDGSTKMSLICSVKERLKFEGEKNMINIFKMWCDADKPWDAFKQKTFNGVVTGVIHTSKKCGVFVEIPELNVTGFVTAAADEINGYKPHTAVLVNWIDMEENVYFDEASGQMVHEEPFVIEDGVLKKCFIKPVLAFAKN